MTSFPVDKSGTACGADFYATANDKASSPEEASSAFDASTSERRRSERVKREKPDYYDALEFDNKRKTTTTSTTSTPTRIKRDKLAGGSGRNQYY